MSAIGLGILVKILIVVSGAAQLLGNFSTPSSHNWSYPTRSKNFVGSWFFEEINLQFAFVGIDDIMINNCRLDHMDVSKKMFLLEDPPAIFFHRRTSSRSGYHNHAGPPAWVDEDITGKVRGIFGGSKLRRNSWPFILFHNTSVSKVEIHQNFTSHLGPTNFQLPPRRRMPRRERSWDRRSPSGWQPIKPRKESPTPTTLYINTTLKGLVSIDQIMFHLGPWISWKGSCQGSNTFTQPISTLWTCTMHIPCVESWQQSVLIIDDMRVAQHMWRLRHNLHGRTKRFNHLVQNKYKQQCKRVIRTDIMWWCIQKCWSWRSLKKKKLGFFFKMWSKDSSLEIFGSYQNFTLEITFRSSLVKDTRAQAHRKNTHLCDV